MGWKDIAKSVYNRASDLADKAGKRASDLADQAQKNVEDRVEGRKTVAQLEEDLRKRELRVRIALAETLTKAQVDAVIAALKRNTSNFDDLEQRLIQLAERFRQAENLPDEVRADAKRAIRAMIDAAVHQAEHPRANE